MTSNTLHQLVAGIASKKIRVVDLTNTLHDETPVLQLPPQWNLHWPFSLEQISRYDEHGPAWYWNNFRCSEHTGTHFDAPIHWVSGKDYEDNATDSIAVEKFIAPACVLDVTDEVAADPDFLLSIDHVKSWETVHGRIEAGSWFFLRTGWSKRTSNDEYLNAGEDGAHTPGPHEDVVRFLAGERNVIGFGTETVGTDAGQAFTFEPPFPCHNFMHGANKFGLASLTNLDQLPPKGAVILAAPLKIVKGSGSPLRVLALIEEE
jgi:kynurenine formamidase